MLNYSKMEILFIMLKITMKLLFPILSLKKLNRMLFTTWRLRLISESGLEHLLLLRILTSCIGLCKLLVKILLRLLKTRIKNKKKKIQGNHGKTSNQVGQTRQRKLDRNSFLNSSRKEEKH